MKKQKRILVSIIVFLSLLLTSCQVFAADFSSNLGEMQFSERYLKYLELSSEEKENAIMPRMYDIPKTETTVINPFKLARMVGSTISADYSLKTVIPENMVIKNQQQTNSCWTFSSLAVLESTLALKDYKSGITTPVVYDFSERHMEYSTSQSFLNNATNSNGFVREVGSGGNFLISIPYLINGTGAVDETEMPFENNEDSIYISEIQDKEVATQVNDVRTFPSYSSADDKTEIIQQMKTHIKNYGGIDTCIYGASIDPDSPVYNNETGAIYCNSASTYIANHAVTIIGWDDNYSTENFVEGNRPTSNGAWIIKNSWGTELARYTLAEMKQYIYDNFPDEREEYGWTSPELITDEDAIYNFTKWGFTIDENNEAYYPIGDKGFMYVSYEDANVYLQLTGIEDADAEVTYENIYQYDQFGGYAAIPLAYSKLYLATEFDKQTTGKEYLTQVSIYAPEKYTCKVYVNPNGTSKSMDDLQLVELEAGESETFEAGYHTIEFLNPIKITGDSFVVVLEIQGAQTDYTSVLMEFNYGDFFGTDVQDGGEMYNNVVVESGKCFWSYEEAVNADAWCDASTMNEVTSGLWPNFDTTIKAFTTSKVMESIEVTKQPTKTSYVVGQNFDKTGMVVKANYANGDAIEITDYTIQDGTALTLGQTSITITYNGFTTTQAIDVVENSVESIVITTPPTTTEYFAGDDFDATGMVVEAVYTDGTRKNVTDYTVQDGQALKNDQTAVTIEYEGKTVTQDITVNENLVVKLEVVADAAKLTYVVGQNFDASGLRIKATYENGTEKEVTGYTVQDGTNLQLGQTTVTIEFEGQTVTQAITVIEKAVTGITIKTMPTKTEYIQNKEELDLTGGVIEIAYNDGTTEELVMSSEEITATGFDNSKTGTQTITLTYKNQTVEFDVVVKELEKPENSNFDNMLGNVTRIRAYYFTDSNQKEYTVLNVELSNISKATENEEMKYYYYLSTTPNEENISDWTEISDAQQTDTGFAFEINTLNLANYEELASANEIYLYVKEVATRNSMKTEVVTSAVALEAGEVTIEKYLDGEVYVETTTTPAEEDNTKAPGTIPKTGKDILMLCLAIAIFIIGKIAYSKYRDIEIK